jgi:signal transduction histidine kinase
MLRDESIDHSVVQTSQTGMVATAATGILARMPSPQWTKRYGDADAIRGDAGTAVVTTMRPRPSVPLRALGVSTLAMTGALTTSLLWPESVLNQQILAAVLALIPAFLLAYYRHWPAVSVLLAVGIVGLCTLHLVSLFWHLSFGTSPLTLILAAPYVAIALGAGWFGEVRRSAAQLRATRLQLIQAEKLESLGRLAAGVAHEVKNPLMTILTGVKVLSRRMSDADESTHTVLQDITDAIRRADTIVSGLLSYSRQHELHPVSSPINDVVERSLRLVNHDLETRRIVVVKDLHPSLPLLELDVFKIEQVLIDLFMNAFQAMGADGTLTIRTLKKTAAVILTIEDTGPGIPPQYLSRVFDPFFTTKPPGLGTGLGLSVSRQIVDMHSGTIEIDNRDTGGARLTLTFPTVAMR